MIILNCFYFLIFSKFLKGTKFMTLIILLSGRVDRIQRHQSVFAHLGFQDNNFNWLILAINFLHRCISQRLLDLTLLN
jgi:hypothetical protein